MVFCFWVNCLRGTLGFVGGLLPWFFFFVVGLRWCLVGFVGGYGVVDGCGSGGVAVEWLVTC